MQFNISSPISTDLPGLVSAAIDLLFSLAGVVALFYLIIGGYSYITSGGDPEAMQGAKATIANAIIGLVVILASYLVINYLMGQLGVDTSIVPFG